MILTTNLPSHVATLQTLLQDFEVRNGRKEDRIERLENLWLTSNVLCLDQSWRRSPQTNTSWRWKTSRRQ